MSLRSKPLVILSPLIQWSAPVACGSARKSASPQLKRKDTPSGGVPCPHAAPASCFGGKYLPSPPPTDRSSFCVASLQTASELRSGGKQLCSCYMRLGAQAGLAAASRVVVCDRGNKRPWFCRLRVEVATIFATRASSFSVASLQTANVWWREESMLLLLHAARRHTGLAATGRATLRTYCWTVETTRKLSRLM